MAMMMTSSMAMAMVARMRPIIHRSWREGGREGEGEGGRKRHNITVIRGEGGRKKRERKRGGGGGGGDKIKQNQRRGRHQPFVLFAGI